MQSKNGSDQENEVEFEDIPHLLALAAEHDRVDILQDLIQRAKKHFHSDQVTSHKATSEYILNHRLTTKQSKASLSENSKVEKKYPNPFIPPLHIAVSSGSVHASTCLLRLGADPSIRPQIGLLTNTEGKVVEEADGNIENVNGFKGETKEEQKVEMEENEQENDESYEEDDEEDEYDSDDYEEYYEEYYSDEEDEGEEKEVIDNDAAKDIEELNETNSKQSQDQIKAENVDLFVPEEWNAFRKYHNITAYELLQSTRLPKNKKRGIEHAFFAEALRAIGSEDSIRLKCLLQSGMKAGNEVEEENGNTGEKSLLEWAIDMNEDDPNSKCVLLLKNWGLHPSKLEPQAEVIPIQEVPMKQNKEDKSDSTTSTTATTKSSMIKSSSPSTFRIRTLQRKIEESQSLALSLSPILDDLIHETKICQTLIIGPSPETNGVSPLVAHVKTMKALIAQKEVEFQQYQTLWENAYDEEQRLKFAFQRQSHNWSKEQIVEMEERIDVFINSTDELLQKEHEINNLENATEKEKEDMIVLLACKLADCETKVRTLRASLVDMSEENTRAIKDVKSLGLSGAVRLARKLRQELVEVENNANEAKTQAEICEKRIQKWILRLKIVRGEDLQNDSEELDEDDDDNYIVVGDDDLEEYEEDSDNDEYSDSSGEYEEYTDDEEEEGEKKRSPSKKITSGESTEIVVREQNGFKFWDLIWRMVGLSKKAVSETKKNTYAAGRQATGVMVI